MQNHCFRMPASEVSGLCSVQVVVVLIIAQWASEIWNMHNFYGVPSIERRRFRWEFLLRILDPSSSFVVRHWFPIFLKNETSVFADGVSRNYKVEVSQAIWRIIISEAYLFEGIFVDHFLFSSLSLHITLITEQFIYDVSWLTVTVWQSVAPSPL